MSKGGGDLSIQNKEVLIYRHSWARKPRRGAAVSETLLETTGDGDRVLSSWERLLQLILRGGSDQAHDEQNPDKGSTEIALGEGPFREGTREGT